MLTVLSLVVQRLKACLTSSPTFDCRQLEAILRHTTHSGSCECVMPFQTISPGSGGGSSDAQRQPLRTLDTLRNQSRFCGEKHNKHLKKTANSRAARKRPQMNK